MIQLLLLTTAGCHLCDEAEHLLKELVQQPQLFSQYVYEPVEIADDDQLIDTYGVRIPVIRSESSGDEIGWPFTLEELGEWIDHQTRIVNLVP